jgi:Ca2+-binding RTX toxin-like protein
MAVEKVSGTRALVSGYAWAEPRVAGEMVITFSFADRPPGYLPSSDYSDAFLQSFRPLSPAEEALARAALQQWDDASGLRFQEVGGVSGDIVFGAYNFDLIEGYEDASGFAAYPDGTLEGGDVFLNTRTPDDLTQLYLYLHEIGHTLGLKHPFDGTPVLKRKYDNFSNTIMTYGEDWSEGGQLGSLDIKAIRKLYGSDDSMPFADKRAVSGSDGAEELRGSKKSEYLQGLGGNDTLIGRRGSDDLDGGAGADILIGGKGVDRFVFTDIASVDTIVDFNVGSETIMLAATTFGLPTGLLGGAFAAGPVATEFDDRIVYDSATGLLSFDVDGIGGAAAVAFAQIGAGLALSVDNFLVF